MLRGQCTIFVTIVFCFFSILAAQPAECIDDEEKEPHAQQVSLLQQGLQIDARVGRDLPVRHEHSHSSAPTQSASVTRSTRFHVLATNPERGLPVFGKFLAEESLQCLPSDEQIRAYEMGWTKLCAPFSGCFGFWHCFLNAIFLVAPFSAVCSLILIALSVRVWFDGLSEPDPFEDSPPHAPTADLEDGETLPNNLKWLCLLCVVMINVNFTIMMPTSSGIVDSKGGSLALSGVVIGSYAMGAVVGVPLMIHLSRTSYKTGFLLAALAGVAGNLFWCYATTLPTANALLWARAICGFEGAIMMVVNNIFMACTTGLARIQHASELAAASCVGLLLGPIVSSAANQLSGYEHGAFNAACFMTCVALLFGMAALVACPSRESVIKFSSDKSFASDPVPEAAAWLGITFLCISMFIRCFQRVFWEAAFLYIVAEIYGYGTVLSGYLCALPLLLLLFMPFVGKPLCKYFGTSGFILVNDCMQIVGMCLMFNWGAPSPFTMTVFIFGSALFYFANWSQIVPIAPFQARFALPYHSVLNMETIPAWSWGLSFIGYGAGPIVSRLLMQACPSQNTLACALLISCAGTLIGQAIALEALSPLIPKYGPATRLVPQISS